MVGHDGHRGWVYYLAVTAGARRRGLGRELMRASEDWLRARGVPKLVRGRRKGCSRVPLAPGREGCATIDPWVDAQINPSGWLLHAVA